MNKEMTISAVTVDKTAYCIRAVDCASTVQRIDSVKRELHVRVLNL